MTLGEAIYSEINSNEYLNEIYQSILLQYANKLYDRSLSIELNINHALRFADLLSKSIDPKMREKQKNIAQEMVSLLYTLYPQSKDVAYCMGSVLTNVGNYRGLQIKSPNYESVDVLERIYSGTVQNLLKVPYENEQYFFKTQKDVIDGFANPYFSYSGPTSMGKTFVIRMFIKQRILSSHKENFAIVVPTKALINEVSSKIIEDLKGDLATNDYRVVTAAGALSLQQKHNFILVLTPERLLYLMLDRPDFSIQYLFIDEAHKISSKDKRSPFYYKLVDILTRNNNGTKVFFSSPNIPNPSVYLKLLPNKEESKGISLALKYTPVCQMKFLVNLLNGKKYVYNNLNDSLVLFEDDYSDTVTTTLTQLIKSVGAENQNIIYCSSTSKAVAYAVDYANSVDENQNNKELQDLIKEIRNEIHTEYYLVDVLSKSVAYHIGYLPTNIRLKIEDLYKKDVIKTIFCTSTLVEGVNLPADNLFITSYKNGLSDMKVVEFKNLIGRVGRIEYNLYGNVFLVIADDKIKSEKFEKLLMSEIEDQKLSLVTELNSIQKQKIIDSLKQGNMELLKHPKSQTADNYDLMRKFAIILLKDIMSDNSSYVKSQFAKQLNEDDIQTIKTAFASKAKTDDDISISMDQLDNLTKAIQNGLSYPQDFEYRQCLMPFLFRLSKIFKWEKYEADTLGNNGKLSWYAVILSQWMQGYGLNQIISKAIAYKKNTIGSTIFLNGQVIPYQHTKEHKNLVITDTLNAIEDVVLFRIANYFLKFSLQYKKINNIDILNNDWYEFVEYGTKDPLTIMLQRNGFSRETSTYIKDHRSEYVVAIGEDLKLKDELLNCTNKSVAKEATEIKYNISDLFVKV